MRPILRRSILSVLFEITLHMIGRRIGAHVPALDAKTVVEFLDRDRLGLVGVFLGAAERVGVHEGEMGEVAQIVDDQQPVGLVVHVAGQARAIWDRRAADNRRSGSDRPFRYRPSRSRSDCSARPRDSCARRALAGSCPGPGSGCTCRPARTSCRDTCSGCRRLRSGPSTAARRDGNSDRRARRPCRWRRDRSPSGRSRMVRASFLPSISS